MAVKHQHTRTGPLWRVCMCFCLLFCPFRETLLPAELDLSEGPALPSIIDAFWRLPWDRGHF